MRKFIYLTCIVFLFLCCSEIEIKWTKKFDAAGLGNYRINDLYSFRDIYVTGAYWASDQNTSCITAKYSEEGELEWFNTYKQQNPKITEGKSILIIKGDVVEDNPDVCVLMESADMNNIRNAILIKYDSLGTIEWEKIIEESPGAIESKIFADDQNNIYVAGWKKNSEESITIFIAKYRSSGEFVWSSEYYNLSLSSSNLKFNINSGNQFLISGIIENSWDFFFMRYDGQGKFLGFTTCETPEQEIILADAKIDNEGNVYLTGTTLSSETGNNYITVAYDKNNNVLWRKHFDGENHLDDVSQALSLDDSSNVYVTGSSETQKGITEIVTVKYNQDGDELWTETFKGRKKESTEPYFLRPGFIHYERSSTVSNFYIAGCIGDDVLILRYNTNGLQKWAARYGKEGTNIPTAFSGWCVAVESMSEEGSDVFIIKYGKSEQFGILRWD